MDLRRALRSSVAAACIAGLAAPTGLAVPAAAYAQAAPRPVLQVAVAQAEDFSRLEFKLGGRAPAMNVRREGQVLVLRFPRDAEADIARLRIAPPRWLKSAEARRAGGALELVLTLADDADALTGAADGVAYVNLFERPPAAEPALQAAAPAAADPAPARPDPLPAGGTVRMAAATANGQVTFTFPFANPAGAAVFRRGDTVWVVFDAPARIDVSGAPRGLRQFSGVAVQQGADYAAVRITSSASTPVFAEADGPVWKVILGPGAHNRPPLIRIRRTDDGGPAVLSAAVAGAGGVLQVPDPVVGDTLTVVTAIGPAKALPGRRDFVEMAFLPSAHGLGAESYVGDLDVRRRGDLVEFGGPGGLTLSPASAGLDRAEGEGLPSPAGRPALIDQDGWTRTGSGGFLPRYNALLAAALEEASQGRDAPVAARMGLARFLVGHELAHEAIGVLGEAMRLKPDLAADPEFRGLRGIARVMARRYEEAALDFSVPVLADDPSAAMWRSYIAYQRADWPEVRRQFAAGAPAFTQFSPQWRARFARGDAEAALAMGDLQSAESRIELALMERPAPVDELGVRLTQAKLAERQGATRRALKMYQAIARAPQEHLATPALLGVTRIRHAEGQIDAAKAAAELDTLRYRWRGDATELEIIRTLGQLHLAQGRYREALEVLRSAGQRLPRLPEAVQLQADLAAAFRGLFLDGLADGLEPVQALALFFDFKELTPIGAEGDLMVRRLVRRLVDVDLLPQAAELLKYQVENRLDGPARAQIASDLALIYLMDRKPEQALQTINFTRTTALPKPLLAERKLVEARALISLGRYDHALELLGKDEGREARELRAEATWKQKAWPDAAALFEAALGDRWKAEGPLTPEEEGRLLRAGVAYSLAGDEAALSRLAQRYGPFVDGARNPAALRVALTGMGNGEVGVADFGRVTADNEVFAGWVVRMKERFRAAPAAAPAKQAQAAKPAAKG